MIQIDLEIPKCCDECKFVYDSCKCIITGSRIDWEKSDSERLLDCPLNKIAEPKTGHCKDCKHFRKLPYHADTLGKCFNHMGLCPKGDWYCADFEPQDRSNKE